MRTYSAFTFRATDTHAKNRCATSLTAAIFRFIVLVPSLAGMARIFVAGIWGVLMELHVTAAILASARAVLLRAALER